MVSTAGSREAGGGVFDFGEGKTDGGASSSIVSSFSLLNGLFTSFNTLGGNITNLQLRPCLLLNYFSLGFPGSISFKKNDIKVNQIDYRSALEIDETLFSSN